MISCPKNETEMMTGVHGNDDGQWISGEGVQKVKSSRSLERSCEREQDLMLVFLEHCLQHLHEHHRKSLKIKDNNTILLDLRRRKKQNR